MEAKETPVLIVGAGPIGLVASIRWTSRGCRRS